MRISTTDPMTLNDVTDNAIAANMQAELATLARSLRVRLMPGGPRSDRPLEVFENAGGVRMGSRISVALQVLGSHVPLFGTGPGRHEPEAGY